MTAPDQTPQIDEAADAYVQQYRRLWETTVATLTEAALMTQPGPEGRPLDFGDFLATALATTTANVGGIDRLVAGRPGSWESSHVHDLATSAGVGTDTAVEQWAYLRTRPVEVPLNVCELVTEYGNGQTLDDAQQALYRAEDKERATLPPEPAEDADEATWTAYHAAHEALDEKTAAAERELLARYASAYQDYARRFEVAVRQRAEAIGLQAPVTLVVEANPAPEKWDQNPNQWDEGDPLVWHLWDSARQSVGLPTVEAPATARSC